MKKQLLTGILALGILITGNLKAQLTNIDPNAPVMTFEKDSINYGTLPHNAEGTRIFHFTNTGKEPLLISSAQGSCGCTVPSGWPQDPIQPGKTADIKVHYATDRVGYFYKWVTVTSNANNSPVKIYIYGTIQPDPTPAATNPTTK